MKSSIKKYLYSLKNYNKTVETCLNESVKIEYSPAKNHEQKPLRILYTAMQFDYDKPRLGFGYAENNFFHSLYNMGHELIRFDIGRLRRKYGFEMMNRMLLEAVFRYDPDILFFAIFTDKISADVFRDISENTRTVTINFNSDDHWRFDNFTRHWAPCFNWNITTWEEAIPKYRAIGYDNVIYSQWACNHFLYKKLNLPKIYDVVFIGQPYGIRRDFVDQIRKAGIKIETWGDGWENGRASMREMVRIYNQSKIVLNIGLASTGDILQIKGRDFEIPGTGSLCLTNYSPELTKYYTDGKEAVMYRNVDEAIQKIRYYLQHDEEREIIARAGLTRTLREHTFERRFNEIFQEVGLLAKAETDEVC